MRRPRRHPFQVLALAVAALRHSAGAGFLKYISGQPHNPGRSSMLTPIRWPDSRDWIGIGTFVLTVFILMLVWLVPDLRGSEFFKSIAVLIIGTG